MKTWSILIKDRNNKASFQDVFPAAGYYEITVPGNKQQKIILLNTVLFTDRVHIIQQKQAAFRQLAWLHSRLLFAEKHHQHVILAFHIPIGIDIFATIKSKLDIKEFWQENYTEKFEADLERFSSVITGILPAHIHVNAFQLIMLKRLMNIPVNFTPSISPIFGNNPGFKIFSYEEDTLGIKNRETYFYPLDGSPPAWERQYSLNDKKQSQMPIFTENGMAYGMCTRQG
jgi:hypothetical protein